ncbi:MAG: tetratricopeptide repeat protein [Chthoniobacterales bacterium]
MKSFFRYLLSVAMLSLTTFVCKGGAAESEASPELVPPVVVRAIGEGNAAFAAQDYKQAKTSYEFALKVKPDNVLTLVNLGLTEFYLKNYDDAEKRLFEALKQDIKTGAAWMVLGMIYMEQTKRQEALAAFSNAVLYEPENARAHNFLGVTIGEIGWYEGAEAEFRKAIALDSKYVDAHFNLAYFCMRRRTPAVELARRHYQKALQLGGASDAELEKQFAAADKKLSEQNTAVKTP